LLTAIADRTSANSSGSTSRHAELSAILSASLRAELLQELEGLSSADGAALWAQQRLAAKNRLSAADAEHVEQAFQSKLNICAIIGNLATVFPQCAGTPIPPAPMK
jgi:hypothetical protein